MLVLARHVREAIVLGDDIVVTVLSITGSRVRLGIEAPTETRVLRWETWEAIQREKGDSEE